MASASQAITRMAQATGIYSATVSRTARALREADTDMWPQGLPGRNQEAHVSPVHLVTLALALAGDDSTTKAPKVAAAYGALVHKRSQIRELPEAHGDVIKPAPMHELYLAPLLHEHGSTLGHHLVGLIKMMRDPQHGQNRETLRQAAPTLTVRVGPIPKARLSLHLNLPAGKAVMEINDYESAAEHSMPAVAMQRMVEISYNLFEVMAELWADTLAHEEIKRIHSAKRHNPGH